MGVYIKDMEMPTEGGTICVYKISGKFFTARAGKDELFPIIPIPAHGRLVDADDFSAEMKKRQDAAMEWKKEAKDSETAARADAVLSFLCEVKLTLDKLPTVIPKEEA